MLNRRVLSVVVALATTITTQPSAQVYQGKLAGSNKNVWYILTDVSDSNVAAELGLNFSTKLQFSSLAARAGNLDAQGNIIFNAGRVNFAPDRLIIPGPPGAEFPPKFAQPGAVGDANYGPLVRIVNAGNVIYNAPMVAFGVDASEINFPNGNVDYSKVHDEVVAIDPINMTVTVNLINGFSFGRPVWYISMDTSIPLGAAIEHNTFAPLMQKLVLGHDDSFASPVERIFIATNGAEGAYARHVGYRQSGHCSVTWSGAMRCAIISMPQTSRQSEERLAHPNIETLLTRCGFSPCSRFLHNTAREEFWHIRGVILPRKSFDESRSSWGSL